MESQYDVRIVGCSGGIGGKRCLLAKHQNSKTVGVHPNDGARRLLSSSCSVLQESGSCLERKIPGFCTPLALREDVEVAVARFGGTGTAFGNARWRGSGLGFAHQGMTVRHASTVAAADILHFTDRETGGTIHTVSEVAPDAVGSVGSSLSEVAAATVDCSYPTAALQHLIDYVHTQAGLPWYFFTS